MKSVTQVPAPPNHGKREIWGILGGMGPLASAEFLKSIYEETLCGNEQDSPTVFLLSDPTIPDRTESLLAGQEEMLMERLTNGIGQLLSNGVTRVVVCCLTIHPLLPRLPASWQPMIVSLLDVIYEAVLQSCGRHLLVCTEGSRRVRLFEQHRSWPVAHGRIVLPGDDDQAAIHKLLYEIKGNRQDPERVYFLEALLDKYGLASYIAGCTEVHILAKEHERLRGCDRRGFCIDPLTSILPLIAGRSSAHWTAQVPAD